MCRKLIYLFSFVLVLLLSGTVMAADAPWTGRGGNDVGANQGLDFGDAPEPHYPTTLAANGARHVIVPGFCLGNSIDGEPDGQPTAMANGDDTDIEGDDEDGLRHRTQPLIPGELGVIVLRNSMGLGSVGFLDAWIDFNGDGSWAEPGDQICFSQPLSVSGWDIVFFEVPATARPDITTFARFRFSSTGYLSYDGPAQDGEVEDYTVSIGEEELATKWVQHPDLSLEGMNVDVTKDDSQMKPPHILADDFECTTTEDLLDIHIWGSWYHDYLPWGVSPVGVVFTLSIHADIPADQSPTGYSMPGPVLWTRQFQPGQFKARPQKKVAEGWYDPVADQFERVGAYRCWQYSFYLDPGEFRQEGTLDKPVVYWLAVQAQPKDPRARFGWKTSLNHWNDDAVWASPLADDWNEMLYPKEHPYHPESIDMAFYLTYAAEAPEQPTSRPVSATQCPVVETQCPSVSTQCPPVQTLCPHATTTCPPAETQCPATLTECRQVRTQCPAPETECTVEKTKCPISSTNCPAVHTQCPAVDTECPSEDTRCPAETTRCPPIKTMCPRCPVVTILPMRTQCPAAETECPPEDTRCPAIPTRCPPIRTTCPPVETQCPVVETECPLEDTRCPAERTRCPPIKTTCPLCPVVTILPMKTQCPAVETKCPAVETECPPEDTRCPADRTRCPPILTMCPLCPVVTILPLKTRCPTSETNCPPVDTECPPVETECPTEVTKCPTLRTLCPAVETQCPFRLTFCPKCFGQNPEVEPKYSPVTAECPAIETQCPSVVAKPLLAKAR